MVGFFSGGVPACHDEPSMAGRRSLLCLSPMVRGESNPSTPLRGAQDSILSLSKDRTALSEGAPPPETILRKGRPSRRAKKLCQHGSTSYDLSQVHFTPVQLMTLGRERKTTSPEELAELPRSIRLLNWFIRRNSILTKKLIDESNKSNAGPAPKSKH